MSEENTYVDNLCKYAKDMIGSINRDKRNIKRALSRNNSIDYVVKTIDEMHLDLVKKEILDKIEEVPKTDIMALAKHHQSLLLDGRELLGQIRMASKSVGNHPTDRKVIDNLKKHEEGLKKELKDDEIFNTAMLVIDKELGLD